MSNTENVFERVRRARAALEISKINSALAALQAIKDEVFLMPKPSRKNIEAAAKRATIEINMADQQIMSLSDTDVTQN